MSPLRSGTVLLAVALLALGSFASGCTTEKTVRAAIAEANAVALDQQFHDGLLSPDKAVADADAALLALDRAATMPGVTPRTAASLRARQALVCLSCKRLELARAYLERVDPTQLADRDAKLVKASDTFLWWLAKGETPAIGNPERPAAMDRVRALGALADGDDDIDFYLDYWATTLTTALVKADGRDPRAADLEALVTSVVTGCVGRFGAEARLAVDFVVSGKLEPEMLRSAQPSRRQVHLVQLRESFGRLKAAITQSGPRLVSAGTSDWSQKLLGYFHGP